MKLSLQYYSILVKLEQYVSTLRQVVPFDIHDPSLALQSVFVVNVKSLQTGVAHFVEVVPALHEVPSLAFNVVQDVLFVTVYDSHVYYVVKH